MSRKREAGVSNRVRAKRLSRLLPSAGSCTAPERVGGKPEASWEQRDETGIARLRVLVPDASFFGGIVAPVIARAKSVGRFRHVRALVENIDESFKRDNREN